MSELDRLVNACLVPAFAGADPPEWILRAVDEGLGGVCLYGGNIQQAEGDIARMSLPLRRQRRDLFVALDEEGGDVTRVHYLDGSPYPGNLALGAVDDVELTRRVGRAIGSDLAALDVNLCFAPAVDVNSDAANPVIGVRSFGSDPELVARHGAALVEGVQACGVAACAKHFPGHGATRADSHLELPVIDCDEETLRSRELVPFVHALEAGVQSVMSAHVVFRGFDELPSTLSRRFLVDLLRGELGFTGVVTTDALDMAGVRARWGHVGGAVRALAAGADQLLLGPGDCEQLCADIRVAAAEAIRAGELTLARVEAAAERVARMAAWAADPHVEEADGEALGLEAARRAVVVEGDLPLAEPPFVVTLRGETNLAVGDARWGLAEPLARLGFLAGSVDVVEGENAVWTEGQEPLVVVCRDAYRRPWQRAFVESLVAGRPDAVVVGMGMAGDRELAGSRFVGTFGASRSCAVAAAERIAGRQL